MSRLIFLALLFATCAFSQPATCPATITVEPALATPASGWTATAPTSSHVLASITFFDGKPEEKASLVYDNLSKDVATWHFTGSPIWVTCTYSGTSLLLTQSLPPAIKKCTVAYNPKQKVDGLPKIERITCN